MAQLPPLDCWPHCWSWKILISSDWHIQDCKKLQTLVILIPALYIFIPPANFVCGGYTPRKLCLWWVYCFHFTLSVRASVRASIRPSVTFCFFNILKSHCWIFIKPCKHVHICKTNTLDKKVRARGQFY